MIAKAGNTILQGDDSHLYLIVSGAWEIKIGASKVLDFAWDDQLVFIEKSPPFIVDNRIWCEIITPSVYYKISMQELKQDPDPETIKHLLDYISCKNFHLYSRWFSLCTSDAYHEVKYAIEWLIKLPEKIREKFSLISFITYISRVSRSHALSIIKALKIGGYIEMYDGHLIKILHRLPDRY